MLSRKAIFVKNQKSQSLLSDQTVAPSSGPGRAWLGVADKIKWLFAELCSTAPCQFMEVTLVHCRSSSSKCGRPRPRWFERCKMCSATNMSRLKRHLLFTPDACCTGTPGNSRTSWSFFGPVRQAVYASGLRLVEPARPTRGLELEPAPAANVRS